MATLDHAVVSWLPWSPPHQNVPHGLSLKHLFMCAAEPKPCKATVPYKNGSFTTGATLISSGRRYRCRAVPSALLCIWFRSGFYFTNTENDNFDLPLRL